MAAFKWRPDLRRRRTTIATAVAGQGYTPPLGKRKTLRRAVHWFGDPRILDRAVFQLG